MFCSLGVFYSLFLRLAPPCPHLSLSASPAPSASTSHLFPVFLITCPIVSCSPSSLFRSVLTFVPHGVVMSFCRVLWILALLQILLGSVLEDICTPGSLPVSE
ncbi:hypothetical protein XENOCAPTIV_005763 [Xenoophorus captivus]|uniref:Uncharacterized protein n=1 Tax=Xenoophorus captivus TaxID=1517983 RepID=A0ABV0QQ74_9TELE